jgi:DNA repair photolyase
MIAELWKRPPTIERNNFKYKALSSWSLNLTVGCSHACRFCYVPEVSTNRMASQLQPLGVKDPDADWGQYVFVRPFDPNALRSSLRRAMKTPADALNDDGNRAIMLCTTTDAYQVIPGPTGPAMNAALAEARRESLKIIRDESDLNVRILTRGPLVIQDFDLLKSFGPRLMLGFSIPSLSDRLAKIYEPHAPAPSRRRETLRKAKVAGLHVFVAVAPTYPECDREDFQITLKAMTEIEPLTIFMEPINIRAENVARIEAHAQEHGYTVKTEVFRSAHSWALYAKEQLLLFYKCAEELNLAGRVHLWPDPDLPRYFQGTNFPEWCMKWWNRKSEWPQTNDSTHLHKLHEFDAIPGLSETGRHRAGKAH